jgi:putative membrane protein
MMDWHDGGMGWGGGVFGGVLLLILLVLAVVGVVTLVRAGHGGSLTLDYRTPEQLLDERLARGEIDIEEYTRRRELLRSAR